MIPYILGGSAVGGVLFLYLYFQHKRQKRVLGALLDNNKKLKKIMATIQELSTKVDELQAALDAEQQQVIDAIKKLQDSVDELLASGGSVEERQAVADKLDQVI